ncbi:proprotein convertase subtilisin/kexin type 4-like isoform X4 [Acropora millepora]|uniref:proprotein convertase subtilisin/kexin type 4-like isoform X4 n=1 Tax=Acropora millepora TaxID=45264 RepID=UPI001CF50E18|nr:proprotein convertase subtilisin/kexin type 4-like isoform X4 [Acropora millepora]
MNSIFLIIGSVFAPLIFISGAVEYSNRWTVQINGDVDEAERLAVKHGFVNQGKIIDNYYSFQHQKVAGISSVPSAHLHYSLLFETNVDMVEQQIMKPYKLLSSGMENIFVNDPMFKDMWYINRDDGEPTYNVIDVWKRNVTGQGVVVAVVDEGFHPDHPEIKDNYDKSGSFDVIDNDTYPVPSNLSVPLYGHGEKCAGVIAAVLNNSHCGVGLAYKSKLAGIRLFFDNTASDADEARALSYQTDHIDIYSNSWGPDINGFKVIGPGPLTQRALQSGAEKGRGNRGSIYVFAVGNGGFLFKNSCAFNGYVNSIYTIGITGINRDGSIPSYGEHCAGIMAVTYSKDSFGPRDSKVITADTNNRCTDSFSSSSAAAAMASGLIALMLSANKDLSWRDVQHIIIRTARPDPVYGVGHDWRTNQAGLKFNDYVGFGLMDARRMVDAAMNWTTVPLKVNCTIPRLGVNSVIPSNNKLEESIDLSDWSDFCGGDRINYLEHVEVGVNLDYTRRGELLIKLISPQGTVSNLTHYRWLDSQRDLNWVMMSLHYWGENATGPWRLTLENSNPAHNNRGTLFNWRLILHGTTVDPLGPAVTGLHRTKRKASSIKPTGISSAHTMLPTEVFPLTDSPPSLRGSSKDPGISPARTVLPTEGLSRTDSPLPVRGSSTDPGIFPAHTVLPSEGLSRTDSPLPVRGSSTDPGISSSSIVLPGKGLRPQRERRSSTNLGESKRTGLELGLGLGLGLSLAVGLLAAGGVVAFRRRREKPRDFTPLDEKIKEKRNTYEEIKEKRNMCEEFDLVTLV